jgi:protein-S-isoprenylcysteine O-methyltransferase Ste14
MTYKVLLVLVILGLVVIRRYYQRGYRREDVVMAQRVVESRVSVMVTAALLLPIFLYLFTDWLSHLDIPFPSWLRWSGFGLGAAGLLLLWWCHHSLGVNWQPDIAIRKEHELVTKGPYAYIRHPMYLSFILQGIGLTLIAANWVIAFFVLLPPIIAYLRRSKQEEAMLEEVFGEAYREYKTRTGNLFSRIKLKK